jgi:exodeoxyribonuclease V alpha subunit
MLANEMLEILSFWHQNGTIRAVDLAVAKFLHQRDPSSDGRVLLAGALASYQYGMGHTCLDPIEFLQSPANILTAQPQDDFALKTTVTGPSPESLLPQLTWDEWSSVLLASPLVGKAKASAPLVLDSDRIYLTRNWDHEQRIAREILARIDGSFEECSDVSGTLKDLFPDAVTDGSGSKPQGPNWQKISAALATEGRLLILTGGPGTGKTYAVARILALLQKDHPLRILLSAPTGKAAARLSESIAAAVSTIPEPLRKYAPEKAITIHQMFGASRHGRRYRHDGDNLLHADVVVIDEASMIDIEMMAAILKALPSSTRLILVGDKDQLASVEAGSVLGDLCKDIESRGYTAPTCGRIESLCGEILDPVKPESTDVLAQRTVMLRYSKRFDDHSGIGILARAINAGETERVLSLIESTSEYSDITSLALKTVPAPSNFRKWIIGDDPERSNEGFGYYLSIIKNTRPELNGSDDQFIAWSLSILEAYSRYQILCATRAGAFGVSHINELAEDVLSEEALINRLGAWYEGRPVMMTRNDYELGIMNGDIGIALSFPNRDRKGSILKVVFRNDDGSLKFVLPSRLSEADTVYAMTIHKSQGSEFEHAVLIFPETKDSPIMSRELIYTGVTRARTRLTILCPDKKNLAEATGRQIRRSGRLAELVSPKEGGKKAKSFDSA